MKKRKRQKVRNPLTRGVCPLCGVPVVLTSGGRVPRHKDGNEWCGYTGFKPEQFNLLVREGLVMTKPEQARQTIKKCLTRLNLKLSDVVEIDL